MQNSLFDFPRYSISKPIRLIELFGGIGSQAMALRDIGANFEHYRLVEFDKYAVSSYNAIHGTKFKTMDIRDVHGSDLGISEKDRYCYLLTYSFPCTDLSVAGRMRGMSKSDWEQGNATRSGLLWEVERILSELPKEHLPDVLLMENVPQVHSEQNKDDFDSWLAFLREKGYQNFVKDLNAKDYGTPQNRERCFCVSILSECFVDYEFPNPVPLKMVMKDFLESNVEERYYIDNDKARELIMKLIANGTLPIGEEKKNKPNFLGNFYGRHDGYDGSVFGTNAPVKTITHSLGGIADILEQKSLPINTMPDGNCRTIKAQYAKTSVANLKNQGTYGATGVAEQRTENREQRTENREQRTENREQRIVRTIDLCVKHPREISVANCIKARYDCGISNLQADGSGVVEQSRTQV